MLIHFVEVDGEWAEADALQIVPAIRDLTAAGTGMCMRTREVGPNKLVFWSAKGLPLPRSVC